MSSRTQNDQQSRGKSYAEENGTLKCHKNVNSHCDTENGFSESQSDSFNEAHCNHSTDLKKESYQKPPDHMEESTLCKLESTSVQIPRVSFSGKSTNNNNTDEIDRKLKNTSIGSELVIQGSSNFAKKNFYSNSNFFEQGDELVNITSKFLDATKSLELGELLHDPSFGLFEAMSAIEMMDPKMDAGMICNKGKRVIQNFDQAVEDGALKLDNFTIEELIGIIDTTICCLVTWLEGHSLAQTVFTNLYLHRPSEVVDKNLKAFSICILKQVDLIEECVSKAGVFEEEDFQPSVYGYNLAGNISDSKSASMLRECEDDIQKKCKLLKNDESKAKEVEKLEALLSRLRLARVFHTLLLHIWKRDNLDVCQKLISTCLECLTVVQKTGELGLQRCNDDNDQFMVGFELLVNQRLLPPTFPRATRIKLPAEAFSFLEGLVQRIKLVLKVVGLQNLHVVLDFFHNFSETRPCVLSRSLLQLLYGPMRFKKPTMEEMFDSMKEALKGFIAPPVLTSKSVVSHNREITDCVEMFFERCVTPFTSYLVACGHNRARQRDKLAHVLEDFANLQIETERIDAYLHNLTLNIDGIRPHGNCFGNWILYHISKLMIRYVLSGFELELYSVHEFPYLYWYMYEFLYGWLISSLSRAEAYIAENEALVKKGSKAKKMNKSKSRAYNKEILLIQAEQNLAGGYFKFVIGLLNDGKLPIPHQEFDNECVRYGHRFAAFNNIRTPAPVNYVQYKNIKELSEKQPSVSMYVAASKSFHQARQYLEAIPGTPEKEIFELLKITKTNFIVAKLLASGHAKETKTPEFDFSNHRHFPTIKVNLSKSE